MGKVKSKTSGLVKIITKDIFNGCTVYVGSLHDMHIYKGLRNLEVKVGSRMNEGDVIGEELSDSKYEVVDSKEIYETVLKYSQ